MMNMTSAAWKSICALVAIGFFAFPSHAQTRMAVINLQKVYDGYYKVKEAGANLREDAAEKEKEYKIMATNLFNAQMEWKKLTERANDQAIAQAERDKAKGEADSRVPKLKEEDQTVKDFVRNSEGLLREKMGRIREKLLKEIYDVVAAKSRTGGYTVVMDLAAQTANLTPVILFSSGENDITEVVLAQINASAPAPVPEKAAK